MNVARNIPEAFGRRYLRTAQNDRCKVSAELKSLIRFGRLNLVELPYRLSGPLDLIVCRNVMIYFDEATRERIVREFHRLLKPGGVLIVAHSEGFAGKSPGFKTIQPSVYEKFS